MAKYLGVALLLAVGVVAEPPVGGYLPPHQAAVGFPSNSYGAPSAFGSASGSFGGATNAYSSHSSGYSHSAPATGYGTPSSAYGAPSGISRNTYAPSASKVSLSLGGPSRRPSSSYGAPSHSAPSSSYGAPSHSYGPPSPAYGAPNAAHYDDQSEPANYAFSYDVLAPEYNVEFGHQESRQHETAKGSYYVLLPDGRRQKVEYTADENGYKPVITYTETQHSGGPGGYPRGPSPSYGPPRHSAGGYQY